MKIAHHCLHEIGNPASLKREPCSQVDYGHIVMGMGRVISLHHQNIERCFAQLGFGLLSKMAKGEFPQAIDMQNHGSFVKEATELSLYIGN